jgi:hypothetical protein
MRRALLAIIIPQLLFQHLHKKNVINWNIEIQLLSHDPAISARETEIEEFHCQQIPVRNNANRENGTIIPEIINIPVVVHVLSVHHSRI